MSINVKESTMICPAEKTPRRSLWLSKLDMMIRQPYSHTHVCFIFRANENEDENITPFFDTKTMKEALSKALVYFYPMAGRLTMNENKDRYEIDCNDEGALFIEAETTRKLADFGADFRPDAEVQKMLIPPCDYSKGISSFPLLLVQLTRFECGGVCLGFAQHHHVADGNSHLHFVNSWARIARGVELGVKPCHERANYLAPRHPPQVMFQHLEYEPSFAPVLPKSFSGEIASTVDCLFKLSNDQVMSLKTQAMSQLEALDYKLSTFEVLAGHVWRTTCMARGLPNDQDVKVYMHTNGRSRLRDPTLPPGYCGNVIFFAASIAKAGDLISNPISYTANKIHEAVKRMENVDYLRSAIDYVESQDLKTLVRGGHSVTCPNLQINSWAKMPIYESDFGWGGPVYAGISGIKCEGQSKIISSPNADGSYTIAIKLFTPHMELFEKYLYDF